jgi:LytR cell envelope-related transcriptional attenuator
VERGPLGDELPRRTARRRSGPHPERGARRYAGIALLALVLIGAAVGAASLRRHTRASATGGPHFQGADVRAPDGVRVTVEVLNATPHRGLGRRAMLYLRDQGFDVVSLGTVPEARDTTLVVGRGTHVAWARLVAGALGAARVEPRADSSRDVDVSVYLGSTWRPPAQPFYP